MKRLIGFILFWIGIGMCIMLFMRHSLLAILIIIACLLLGYNLFTNCDQPLYSVLLRRTSLLSPQSRLRRSIPCSFVARHRGASPYIIKKEHILPCKHENVFFFYDARLSRDYALSTLPERRHEVHTYIFFVPPFTFTLTDFKFDFQILLLLL